MVPRTQTPAPDIKSASICKPMAGRVLWGFVFFLCLCHVTTLGMVRKRHPSTATTIKPTHADTDDVQSRDGCVLTPEPLRQPVRSFLQFSSCCLWDPAGQTTLLSSSQGLPQPFPLPLPGWPPQRKATEASQGRARPVGFLSELHWLHS